MILPDFRLFKHCIGLVCNEVALGIYFSLHDLRYNMSDKTDDLIKQLLTKLDKTNAALERIADYLEPSEETESASPSEADKEILAWLNQPVQSLIEETANAILADDEEVSPWGVTSAVQHYFSDKTGLLSEEFSSDMRFKLLKVSAGVEKVIKKREKEQLDQESKRVPDFVDLCLSWAKENGLRKVTLSDMDTFESEKNLDILSETSRKVYSRVNTILRASRTAV